MAVYDAVKTHLRFSFLRKIFILIGCRFKMTGVSGSNALETLKDYNLAFNADGELRQIDSTTGLPGNEKFEFAVTTNQLENQKRYEAIGDVITEYVYELLEQNGLQRIYLNPNDKDGAFVFSTKANLSNTDKLLILIHGSGVVRAGQWSRSLIVNHCLDKGTQLPYIKRAKALGYEVLITNTNQNNRLIDGKVQKIPGSEDATTHARSVWDTCISSVVNLKSIGIVAHSYGGIVTLDLAQYKPVEFQKHVFGVAFTDSVHSFGGASKGLINVLRPITRNWVTSRAPLGSIVSDNKSDITRVSAGHEKHEWTSWAAESSVFDFIEEKARDQKSREEL